VRLVVVSAHYPPNFVSGGTLQPQRLARAFAERGHDVWVYAGWLGDEREPGERFTTVEGGIEVRWIVTTPWTDWSDERNYENAEIEADFARFLAEVDPDVVHLHSLQSLGAGLASASVAAAIPTVVTMHDFWWFCGRQFLVDRNFQPCCPVVDAGVCECHVNRAWLERRNRRLLGVANTVDLVLAPSRSAAELLAANGVDPSRLEVDENGLLRQPDAAPARHADRKQLVFMYGGASNPMKGAHILFEALRLLANDSKGWRRPWTVKAYGVDDFVRDNRLSVSGLPVETLPPYRPDEADAVWADADMLLLPSVMRESHSLITREALVRKVPVLTTDSVGPEEVIEHGVNGLIVAAGDAAELAEAMAHVINDPDMLTRLTAGCQTTPARTLDEQVEELEKRYEQLAAVRDRSQGARGNRARRRRTDVHRVLFVCGIEGAPLRYRAHLPAEALSLVGVETDIRHYRDPDLEELADRSDAVVFYRSPATLQLMALIDRVRSQGIPALFDVDDLIFDPDLTAEIPALQILPPEESSLWLEGVRRYRTVIEACDAFIGSTLPLCRYAEEATGLPAYHYPNGVGIGVGRISDRALARPRKPGPTRVGYFSGTDTHVLDWQHIEPAIVHALARHPTLELWLGGHIPDAPALMPFGKRVQRLPMMPWTDLPGVLRDVDINLAPLEPRNVFNESKSAIKWLEAALTATPTIASPTEPFREAIDDGQNGMVADTPDDWKQALDVLVSDDDLRNRMGRRARRTALMRWSPHLQADRYLSLLTSAQELVAAGERPRPRPRFAPVVIDEPTFEERFPLEPYAADEIVHKPSTVPPLGVRLSNLVTKGTAAVREDGVGPTARRVAQFTKRQYTQRVRG